jgi:phospholipid/cholesterol/gamma-HCH transport system permease protein
MSSHPPLAATAALPLAWVGRQALAGVSYLGGLAVLLGRSGQVLLRDGLASRPVLSAVAGELAWVLGMGLPLVALVHVGMGSFLSMQSYFGGTFVEGAGAVVGVGLIRNVAPMMASMTLAGLVAARVVPDLRARLGFEPGRSDVATGVGRDEARPGFLERSSEGRRPAPAEGEVPLDRLAAARIVAAGIAGPVLAAWGSAVGTAVGWQIGRAILGVSTHSFFVMFWDMLWFLDVLGLLLKGAVFGIVAGLFACHEGLRVPSDGEAPGPVPTAACRAACLAVLTILVINSGWFLLLYHAGTAFGPTLLPPPSR